MISNQIQKSSRRGYTLLEIVIGTGAASLLMVGMTSTLFIANRGLEAPSSDRAQQTELADVQRELLSDLQHAQSFSERTANAVTLTVPDRDGDGADEVLRYAWSGTAADPLTLETNGGAPVILANNVQQFDLDFLTRSMTAPVIVEDIPEEGANLLFVSGGELIQPSFLGRLDGQQAYVEESASEDYTIQLFESWGYTVTKISPFMDEKQFKQAVAEANLVYVSPEAFVTDSGLIQTGLGVVNAQPDLVDEFGFATDVQAIVDKDVDVQDNAHYIVDTFEAYVDLDLLDDNTVLTGLADAIAPDIAVLGSMDDKIPGLVTLSPGAEDVNGRSVPGRRVQLPWGFPGFSESQLNTAGLTVLQKSLEWAAGAGEDIIP